MIFQISYKKFPNNPCADSSKQMIYVRVEFASRRFPDVKMGIYFSLNQIREQVE